MKLKAFTLFAFAASVLSAQEASKPAQTITLASGVPMHIRVTRTAALRKGATIDGILTEPIYVFDRLVLPKDTLVHGTVVGYAPPNRKLHAQALLNGDVTPMHEPVVNFTSLHTASGIELSFQSHALIRNTQLVRFTATGKKPSLQSQLTTLVKERVKSTKEQLFSPGKMDRALQLLYSQLPYHPQRIWAGTQFIADLDAPTTIELPFESTTEFSTSGSLNGITVRARLAQTIDSSGAKKNDDVTAIVTEPVFDADHKLLLAEGAELEGTVTGSRGARSFGRNGELRFAFRGVKADGKADQKAYGTVIAAQGNAGENIAVDKEGNVKANPDKNRFVAPLLLAATALAAHDNDGINGGGNAGRLMVASNGFGLVARVLALTVKSQNVSYAFSAYGFAKSVYFRFLAPGNQVSFPKDTEVEVQLAVR